MPERGDDREEENGKIVENEKEGKKRKELAKPSEKNKYISEKQKETDKHTVRM